MSKKPNKKRTEKILNQTIDQSKQGGYKQTTKGYQQMKNKNRKRR